MRSSLSAGWKVRPKQNRFLELTGKTEEPETVMLPHDAMIGTERDPSCSHMNAYFPDGVWEYSTTLDVPAEWRDRRVHVQFEGVYRDASVYVNDDYAGGEPNGYAEFTIDLDAFLRYGEVNTLKVECRAGDDSRWYSGAGIYRPVHLWVQQPVRLAIDGLSVTTTDIDDSGAVIEIAAEISNDTRHTTTVRTSFEIADPAGTVVAKTSIPVTLRPHATAVARRRVRITDTALWSPDRPALYRCAAIIESDADESEQLDRQEASFGVRSLQLDTRHGLRINGETVKLRGACIHHDNGPIGAATIERAEVRRVERLKAAGFNAIRCAHNPMSRAMLDACDRLGVVVMDELTDMWTESKRDLDHSLRFPERWSIDMASMVRKDRNHPSVVMYSIGNEIPEIGSPLGASLSRELAEEVRRLDPTRYVTQAIQPFLAIRDLFSHVGEFLEEPEGAEQERPRGVNAQMAAWTRIKDRMMQAPFVDAAIEEVCASLDIAGYNYLDVRYDIDRDAHPDRVIVGSETYATVIGRTWPQILASDHVIGDFTWTGWDYLGEVGVGRIEYGDAPAMPGADVSGKYPWLLANAGDIDILGHRRAQSYYREIVFGQRREPFIGVQRPQHAGETISYSGPWTWSDVLDSWTWPGFEGTPLGIEVYSDADEVELVRNGESLGRQPVGGDHHFRALFSTTYVPGDLTAIAFVGGVETSRTMVRTAGADTRLHVSAERAEIMADCDDLAYLHVVVADDNGIVHPCADQVVKVELTGPAVVQGFASADPRSTESFRSTTCTTFEGRALCVVRPTGPGQITATFTGADFDPVTVAITAVAAE